jgi:hypothetical protein
MYKLVQNPFTKKVDSVNKTDGNVTLCIPFNPDNTDYQAYLKWVSEGNTPLPAENT